MKAKMMQIMDENLEMMRKMKGKMKMKDTKFLP